MSLEAILAAIEAAGAAEIARLQAETESRLRVIQARAEEAAARQHEAARAAALEPAAGERARLLHQARLQALRQVGEARDGLVQAALDETRLRLMRLRSDPDYPHLLRGLTLEALGALGREGAAGSGCRVEVDPRDEPLARRILAEIAPGLEVSPALTCCGGVVVRSSDDRIVAANTLESRLERALPYLRQFLAGLFENSTCPSSITPMPAFGP